MFIHFPIDSRAYIFIYMYIYIFLCLKEIKVKYKGEKKEGTTTEIGLGVMRVISCLGGQFFLVPEEEEEAEAAKQ